MTYTPHVWSRHDKLDSTALNNLEQAVGAFSISQMSASDATIAPIITSGTQTVAAVNSTIDAHLGGDSTNLAALAARKNRVPLMLLDYAAGDGTTNDTTAVQTAINDAIAQQRALYSPPAATYLVGPLTINGTTRWEGTFSFVAAGTQTSVLTLSTNYIDFGAARVSIDGKTTTQYGIIGANCGRTNLGHLIVQNCTLWGVYIQPTGNNNHLQSSRFVGKTNGTKYAAVPVTQTAATSNVNTSITGYSTLTLGTPLAAAHASLTAVQWVIYSGNAYKVRSVDSTTQITVLNLDLTGATSPTVDVLAGGALGLPKFTDTGVGSWNSLEISGNPGVGVLHCPLYGHTFNDLVLQGNGIGFAVDDYTNAVTLIKPYFELNTVDIAVWSYMQGTIEDPTLNIGSNIQFVSGRISAVTKIPQLIIRKGGSTEGGLLADLAPASNPGARTITLGQTYAFYRASGSWSLTINSAGRPVLGQYVTTLVLSHGSATTTSPITITPSVAGETIEGGSSYTGAVTGRTVVLLSLIGTDWKVTILRDRSPAISITSAPTYLGQTAVVSGVIYMATGISATTDWKQIS